MPPRHQTQTQSKASAFARLAPTAYGLPLAVAALAAFAPLSAEARQEPVDIDMVTTGSITSQAMIWTVDPSIILFFLIAAFVTLVATGFILVRRSLRDTSEQQTSRPHRAFE